MTSKEFREIRQAMKLRGFEIAKRIGVTTEEAFEFESGKKSIPDHVSKYLEAFKPAKINQE